MKDQYFGDINDFKKYCILAKLSEGSGLPICFTWMLTPQDGRPDGKKINYLNQPDKWRHLNPRLFDFLHEHVLVREERNVALFRNAPGFKGSRFVEDLLTPKPSEQDAYFKKVAGFLKKTSLVFFDPDNGLEVKSVAEGVKKSPKHLYWRDLELLYSARHSALIYQHFPREKRSVFIRRIRLEVAQRLNTRIFTIRTPNVLFIVAAQKSHELVLRSAMERNLNQDSKVKQPGAFEFVGRWREN